MGWFAEVLHPFSDTLTCAGHVLLLLLKPRQRSWQQSFTFWADFSFSLFAYLIPVFWNSGEYAIPNTMVDTGWRWGAVPCVSPSAPGLELGLVRHERMGPKGQHGTHPGAWELQDRGRCQGRECPGAVVLPGLWLEQHSELMGQLAAAILCVPGCPQWNSAAAPEEDSWWRAVTALHCTVRRLWGTILIILL